MWLPTFKFSFIRIKNSLIVWCKWKIINWLLYCVLLYTYLLRIHTIVDYEYLLCSGYVYSLCSEWLCVFTTYSFIVCSVCMYWVLTVYSLLFHCVFTEFSLCITCVFTVYSLCMHSLYIHCILIVYSLWIHCAFTVYLLCIHYVFIR